MKTGFDDSYVLLPFSGQNADHEVLRLKIRKCKNICDFLAVYEDLSFAQCLNRLRNAQLGRNRENWSKYWAEELSKEEQWAVALNQDRKTVTVFIKEICDRWNPDKAPVTVTADDIIYELGDQRIIQMVKLCIVMDRANAMFNMIDHTTNIRGLHWYADRDWHRRYLQQQGALPIDGKASSGHTMNKRYLWLMERDEFQPLGLSVDEDLQAWIRPQASPLRVLIK